MPVLFLDLEGPLSPQDNAYELMGLIPNGRRVFEVISRYDDLLAIEGREEYEPGDTLSLIVPFLVHEGIKEKDVKEVSDKAYLVQGASELTAVLQKSGWSIYIISTSYEQHALNIAARLGLTQKDVACTVFPLDKLEKEIKKKELTFLSQVKQHILSKLFHTDLAKGVKDRLIKTYLDRFYWKELPKTTIGVPNKRIRVVGGRRKVWAIERIARQHETFLEQIAFVGDSITDAQSARVVEAAGGLSIAFNGNAFVVPYATVGVASTNLLDIKPILDAWQKNGRQKAKAVVESMRITKPERAPYYDWLVGKKPRALTKILEKHKITRSLVRAEAAKLG